MTASSLLCFGKVALQQLQARFLSILPRIRTHARIYFRHVKCHCRKADFIAEVIALAWKWFLRLAQRGKDACRFPSVLPRKRLIRFRRNASVIVDAFFSWTQRPHTPWHEASSFALRQSGR